MKKELLFSLTKKDFNVETYKSSGPGGQGRDKRDTAVRISHPASRAVATCQDNRSQTKNKTKAFQRLLETEAFKKWHKIECARAMGNYINIDEQVDKAMKPENLRIEMGPF